MAISPKNIYPARVISGDSAYPYGRALNIQGGVEGTGTPLEAEWVNDMWGFQQSLLYAAGVVPNGQADSVSNSQYLEALKGFQKPASSITTTQGGTVQDFINSNLTALDSTLDIPSLSGKVSGGEKVPWLGYYEPSDGGGNWGIVHTGTHTADGGSIFSIDSDTYVKANTKGTINSKMFGCVADGVTDDLPQLQKMVDHKGSTGGGKCVIKNGSHFLNENGTGVNNFGLVMRYPNMELAFESRAAVLRPNSSVLRKCISIMSDVSGNPSQFIDSVKVYGGTINGGNSDVGAVTTESAHGFDIRKGRNIRVYDMGINKCRGDGFYIAYGCDGVHVYGNNIDGQRANSVSGVRQGVAVLSGKNIRIYKNSIKGTLLGVDVEIDDNQINNGYDYLENIFIDKNEISAVGSEAIAVITPLVTSTVSVSNIQITYNMMGLGVDETLIDVAMGDAAGEAKRIIIEGNQCIGSDTFKGVGVVGCHDVKVVNNQLGNCLDDVIQFGARCKDLYVAGNTGVSINKNGLRFQESVNTERTQVTIGAGNNIKAKLNGLMINGAFETNISGGNRFEGDNIGGYFRGSTVSGNDTRAITRINGSTFVNKSGVAGTYAMYVDFDNRSFAADGVTMVILNDTSDCVYLEAVGTNSPRFTDPYIMTPDFTQPDPRRFFSGQVQGMILTTSIPFVNTGAELNDATSLANTVGKRTASSIWNDTTETPVFSTGITATAPWVDAAGNVVYNPS